MVDLSIIMGQFTRGYSDTPIHSPAPGGSLRRPWTTEKSFTRPRSTATAFEATATERPRWIQMLIFYQKPPDLMICQLCLLTSGSSMIFYGWLPNQGVWRRNAWTPEVHCAWKMQKSSKMVIFLEIKVTQWWLKAQVWFFFESKFPSMFSQRTWCFFWGKPHKDRQLRAHRSVDPETNPLAMLKKLTELTILLPVHLLRFQWCP